MQKNIEIYERNSLFGSTDYKLHERDTIKEANELMAMIISRLSVYDLKQNINYYKNSLIFDTIIYSGYRGGYRFYIGFKTDKDIKTNDIGQNWNEFITNYF